MIKSKFTQKRQSNLKLKSGHKFYMLYFWLLSYIIICLILSCCSIFFYASLNKSSRNYVERNYYDALTKTVIQLDNKISLSNKLYNSLQSDRTVKLLYTLDNNSDEFKTAALNLSVLLQKTISSSDFESAYIFFADKKYVISNSIQNNQEEFFNYYYANTNLNYDEWIKQMNTPNLASYIPVYENTGTYYVDFMYQLPSYTDGSSVQATLVFRLPDTALKKLTYSKEKIGATYILDRDNIIIMADVLSDTPLRPYAEYVDGEVHVLDNSVTICHTSSHTGWKYLYVSDNDEFYTILNKTKNFHIAYISFSLILCLALGIFFSIKNYIPLNELIKIYKRQSEEVNDKSYDYNIIKNALLDYVQIKRNLNILENKQQQPYIINYLSGLLNGSSYKENSELINFPSEYFTVILFSPYNNENLFGEYENVDNENSDNTTFFIIQNVMEELLNKSDFCKIIKYNEYIVGIYSFNDENNTQIYKNSIHNAITYGMSVIKNNFQFGCNIGISSVKFGLKNISIGYIEAELALNSCSNSNGDLIFYDEIYHQSIHKEQSLYNSLTTRQNNLVTCINNSNADDAVEILNQVYEQCTTTLSVEKTKIVLLHFASTILSFIEPDNNSTQNETNTDFLYAMNFNNPSQTYEVLKKLVIQVCESEKHLDNKANYNQRNDVVLPQIIDYIRENYTDYNLNLSTLSEKFGFSSYYISKMFKSATGETLVDFIAKLRIEKSKQLLETTDLPIADIYKHCGFVSEKTFFRTFSKLEAMTPGKYRANNKFCADAGRRNGDYYE